MKINEDLVDLVGYRNRTKIKTNINFIVKASDDIINQYHKIDNKYKKSNKYFAFDNTDDIYTNVELLLKNKFVVPVLPLIT